jgi:hypothetical protein
LLVIISAIEASAPDEQARWRFPATSLKRHSRTLAHRGVASPDKAPPFGRMRHAASHTTARTGDARSPRRDSGRASAFRDRIDAPDAWNTLELVLSEVDEAEPGAGNEILDGLGDENLAAAGERGDASTGDDGDAG